METQDEQCYEQPTALYLFKELEIPDLFWWIDIELIVHNYRNTASYLNGVLYRTQGRMVQIKQVASPTEYDWLQIASVYDKLIGRFGLKNPPQNTITIYTILINTANRKILAREIYDDLRYRIEYRRCNDVGKELILVRAKQWLAEIEKESDPTPQQMTDIVAMQLERCFEPINGGNHPHQPRYSDFRYLDDWGDTDLDQYGYSMGVDRVTKRECEILVEAYKVWAQMYQQRSPTAQPHNDEQTRPDEQPANSHFTTGLSKDQLTTIFERLKNGRYLHADSVLEDWLMVCGAKTTNAPVKPLNWLKAQNILAWLIDQLFEDLEQWEITAKCFTIKGKAPNTNSMKNEVSKVKRDYKSKPTAFVDLEQLLKD